MYRIERRPLWYLTPWRRPWTYELILTAYGGVWGSSWTKRGAEFALVKQQSEWFTEDRL